jgi:hypothetical protein
MPLGRGARPVRQTEQRAFIGHHRMLPSCGCKRESRGGLHLLAGSRAGLAGVRTALAVVVIVRTALAGAVGADGCAEFADFQGEGTISDHAADTERTNLDALAAACGASVRRAAGDHRGETFLAGENARLASRDTGFVFHGGHPFARPGPERRMEFATPSPHGVASLDSSGFNGACQTTRGARSSSTRSHWTAT